MKLRNKALICITLTWIFFLALACFDTIRYPLANFIPLVVLSFLVTLCLVRILIVRHVEKLNEQITEISSNKSILQHVDIKGHDELSSIAEKINLLLDQANTQPKEQQDISVQTTQGDYLTQLERYDSLTALPNRIYFNEILNKSISFSNRHKKALAVLRVDLDAFKKIIETLGQQTADQIIKEVCARFAKTLRSEDLLARLEGDEFIVLLNDIAKPKFASAVAEKLLSACSEKIKVGTSEINITASIGICIYPNDASSLEPLIQKVDAALAKAKNAGGNCFQFYTEEMDVEAHEYIQLENALRNALEKNEFTLYYQPKFHIKEGKINGVEALIRWIHPEHGVINPAKFLPVAEDTGLIMKMGEWALREACKANKAWQDEGYEHISVAVNLSAKQFHHPEIADLISKVLNETKLNPSYLEIELTETTVMDHAGVALNILNKIKQIGVKISLDHFGTGYTSISHLKLFPISTIKIDQNFIKGVPNNPNDSAITSAVIALAHFLGFDVVAEGVETAEQVQYLGMHNCDMVQGYYLSHPVPAQKMILQFRKIVDEVL